MGLRGGFEHLEGRAGQPAGLRLLKGGAQWALRAAEEGLWAEAYF